jgi:hypothetical protein
LGLATTALISGAGAGVAATKGAGGGSGADTSCAGTDADADAPTVTGGGVSLRTGGSLGAAAGNANDSGTKRTGAKPRTAAVCGGVDVAIAGVDDPGFGTFGVDVAGVDIAGVDATGAAGAWLDAVGIDAIAAGTEADGEEGVAVNGTGVTSIGVANIASAFSSRCIVAKNMATAPSRMPHAAPSMISANLRRNRTVGAK